MKIKLLIILIICMFSNVCIAALPNNQQLSTIEKQVFGYDYPNDTEVKRLDRVENYLYGKTSANTAIIRLKKINNDLGVAEPSTLTKNNSNITPKGKNKEMAYTQEDPSVNYPIVDKIEQKVLNKIYKGENIYARLSRLEKKVYNQPSNDSLSNRVNNLRLSVLDSVDENYTASSDGNDYVFEENSDSDNTPKSNDKISKFDGKDDFVYANPRKSKQDYFNMELNSIEKILLKESYENEPIKSRLSRLESQVFQRNFPNDIENDRLDRIAAAVTAKKTSVQYDNNKLMKRLTTGAQVGSILLMILAIIL